MFYVYWLVEFIYALGRNINYIFKTIFKFHGRNNVNWDVFNTFKFKDLDFKLENYIKKDKKFNKVF